MTILKILFTLIFAITALGAFFSVVEDVLDERNGKMSMDWSWRIMGIFIVLAGTAAVVCVWMLGVKP